MATSLDFASFKDLNSKLSVLKFLAGDYAIQTMPQQVSFETTFVCNLRCPHCQTHGSEEAHKIYNSRKMDMPRSTLTKVARQALPWAKMYTLSLSGEPLVTADLDSILSEVRPYGAKLDLVTNGTYFSKEMLVRLLPVLARVQVSIDGATKKTCEAIRLGVKFEKLLRNIRLLTRTVELLPESLRPQMMFAHTIMGSNIRELPEMVKLAHALKMPSIYGAFVVVMNAQCQNEPVELYQPLYNAYYEQAQDLAVRLKVGLYIPEPFAGVQSDPTLPVSGPGLILGRLPEEYYEMLPSPESYLDELAIEHEAKEIATVVTEAKAISVSPEIESLFNELQDHPISEASFQKSVQQYRERISTLAEQKDEEIQYCDYLHKRIYVSSSGDVTPCCVPGRPVLGNVHRNSIQEIWNGEAYNEFRRRFFSSNPVDCCKGCVHALHLPRRFFLEQIRTNEQ